MAVTFSIVQSGSEFYAISNDGTQVEGPLALPAGVTVRPGVRAQYSILQQKVIITRAVTPSVWLDPLTFVIRKLSVEAPPSAPTLAAGSGTGLTGTVYGAYSYVVHINGVVVQESPLSPLSGPAVLANDDIDWSALVPSADPAVTGYRLYRTVQDGNPSVLFRAIDLPNPAATGYTGDAVPDASLDILPAPQIGNPPPTLGVCVAWRNRLWAVGIEQDEIDDLRYTDIDNPFNWELANSLPVPVKGEDQWGVTGFLPRRDELVVCKRSRMSKVIGEGNGNFELIIVAEGPGSVSPDSCQVIDDTGYCQGVEAVWEVGSAGPQDITAGKVGAWFQTDAQFDRGDDTLPHSIGGYNPATHAYELQMALPGDTNIAVWAAFNLRHREWTGPHLTFAATLTARGTIRDPQGQVGPLLGDEDGYLYLTNQAAAYDLQGNGTTRVGIAIDWRTKRYVNGTPGLFKVWGQAEVYQRAQGLGADGIGEWAELWVFDQDIDERTLYLDPSILPATRRFKLPLTRTRVRFPRLGLGQSVQLWVRHNYIADPATGALVGAGTSPTDVELWAIELPSTVTGRR